MPFYQTPGVYYERLDVGTPAIRALRTDVTGFVGLAERGPLDTPVPIESWRQFRAHFGGFTGVGFLAYIVRAFFENGGRRCWVVRVASREEHTGAGAAGLVMPDFSGNPMWRIAASSPGRWGNRLSVILKETRPAQVLTDPRKSRPAAAAVSSISGFERGTLVRLSQDTAEPVWQVVSAVDPENNRLMWLHAEPGLRLPYDRPFTGAGFQPDRPVLIEAVAYSLTVRESGRPLVHYEGLTLVPEHRHYGPRVLAPLAGFEETGVPERLPAFVPPVVIEELRPVEQAAIEPSFMLAPLFLGVIVALDEVIDPRRLRLSAPQGVAPGTSLEFLNPLNRNAVVGGPVLVTSIDREAGYTLTLAGAGLSATQLAAVAAAAAAGTPLLVRAAFQIPEDLPLSGGRDGLAGLMVYDFIGEDISPLDLETVKTQKRRGLRNLEAVGEVSLLDVPDIHVQPVSLPETAPGPPCKVDICLPPVSLPPAPPRTASTPELPPVFSDVEIFLVQDALIQQCEKLGDRLALLSQPYSACREDDLGIAAVLAWRRRFDSKYAALFYPWLRLRDPLQAALGGWRDLPATGHVAGQCAATDFDTGVHKAPANAPLAWVQDVTAMVDDTTHGVLNAAGINVIRPRPARGLRLLGARTVSSDPDWRYVNVRRLLNMMKRAIDLSTQWAAFAPNDVFTRAKLRLSLINFLASLWQRGALMGGAMEEAFFVKCDEENNPPRERDQGKLIVEIGVAPSVPFEFIVLRVGRTGNEVEIAELPGRQGG